MHVKQKMMKGVFQYGDHAFNKDIAVRIQMAKDKSATISFLVKDVIITVNRAELFKFLGGKIYE